jgi:hypothetical protein
MIGQVFLPQNIISRLAKVRINLELEKDNYWHNYTAM